MWQLILCVHVHHQIVNQRSCATQFIEKSIENNLISSKNSFVSENIWLDTLHGIWKSSRNKQSWTNSINSRGINMLYVYMHHASSIKDRLVTMGLWAWQDFKGLMIILCCILKHHRKNFYRRKTLVVFVGNKVREGERVKPFHIWEHAYFDRLVHSHGYGTSSC